MGKTAVVLFNLGGPDGPAAVQPFLFNLFNDPAIIGLPGPLRWLLARLISTRRAPVAQEIYARLGGASPLLANTKDQARALEDVLGAGFRVFVAMRYWHPRADAVAKEISAWGAERVILLPLYPQFSTTTTGSSLNEWRVMADRAGISAPTTAVCCFPTAVEFVAALAARIKPLIVEAARAGGRPRLLLTAHGLPEKIVRKGDPYQWQIEQTAAGVVAALADEDLDWVVCYQSRVGPLEWIGPATEAELRRAGEDGVPVVVAPIAFVSEHSETLVELDMDYKNLAETNGVPGYFRVPTVATDEIFIAGLARLVWEAAGNSALLCGEDACPEKFSRCPLRVGAS